MSFLASLGVPSSIAKSIESGSGVSEDIKSTAKEISKLDKHKKLDVGTTYDKTLTNFLKTNADYKKGIMKISGGTSYKVSHPSKDTTLFTKLPKLADNGDLKPEPVERIKNSFLGTGTKNTLKGI